MAKLPAEINTSAPLLRIMRDSRDCSQKKRPAAPPGIFISRNEMLGGLPSPLLNSGGRAKVTRRFGRAESWGTTLRTYVNPLPALAARQLRKRCIIYSVLPCRDCGPKRARHHERPI